MYAPESVSPNLNCISLKIAWPSRWRFNYLSQTNLTRGQRQFSCIAEILLNKNWQLGKSGEKWWNMMPYNKKPCRIYANLRLFTRKRRNTLLSYIVLFWWLYFFCIFFSIFFVVCSMAYVKNTGFLLIKISSQYTAEPSLSRTYTHIFLNVIIPVFISVKLEGVSLQIPVKVSVRLGHN